MTTRTTVHLDEEQTIDISLMELTAVNSVALNIVIKQGYRTVNDITLTSDSKEQEEVFRMLSQAFHEYKVLEKHLASL